VGRRRYWDVSDEKNARENLTKGRDHFSFLLGSILGGREIGLGAPGRSWRKRRTGIQETLRLEFFSLRGEKGRVRKGGQKKSLGLSFAEAGQGV